MTPPKSTAKFRATLENISAPNFPPKQPPKPPSKQQPSKQPSKQPLNPPSSSSKGGPSFLPGSSSLGPKSTSEDDSSSSWEKDASSSASYSSFSVVESVADVRTIRLSFTLLHSKGSDDSKKAVRFTIPMKKCIMDATFILGPDGRSLDFDYQRQAEEVQMTPGGFLYGGHATFRSTSIKGAHRAVFDEDPTKLFNIGTHIKLNNLSKNSGQSRSFIVDLYLFDRPTKKDGNEDVESDDSEDGDERTRNKLKSVFGGFGSYLAQGPIENYESDDGDNSDNDGDDESDEDYDQSDEDYDQSDEDYDQSDEDYNKSDEDYDDNDQDSSNPQDDKEESGRKTKGKDKKREEDESGRKTRGREKKREEEESRRTTKGKEKKWEEEEEEEEEQQKKQAKKTKRSRDTNDGDDEKPSSSASTSRNVNKKTRR